MSTSSLYVVSVATKSPDGDGAAPISKDSRPEEEPTRKRSPYSEASPLDGEEREVLPPQVPAELQVEVVGLDLEGPPEGDGDVAAEEGPELEEEVADRVLAPLGLDEVEDRVPVPVGRVAFDVRPS